MSNPGPRVRPPRRRASPPVRRARVAGRRVRLHHARSLGGTLGLTTLGTLVPGSAILLAGRRRLGLALLLVSLLVLAAFGYAATHREEVLAAAVTPDKLLLGAGLLSALVVGLLAVALVTYRTVRRPYATDRDRLLEMGFVVVLCLVVVAPFVVGARYAFVQRDLVTTVFTDHRPVVTEGEKVWGEDQRVNVLLLGGDGGVHRVGIRTDTVMLASLDAEDGDATLFSLPRNLQNVPFPEGSELDKLYPKGFDGAGDPLEWMLNAVYGKVPELHPDLFNGSENEGAAALKQAVSAALGVPVDYYVLVNLRGFREVVDAIGGVTVNINHPVPIGGNADQGIEPKGYLEPGPTKHLNGFEALWFARGRYGLDDYDRMERQRCVVQALIDEIDPVTVLRRYEALAAAGKEIVRTDIPQALVPEFVQLGLELRSGDVQSLVFQMSNKFDPNDPDYDWVRKKVERVLTEPEATRTPGGLRAAPGARPSGAPEPRPSPSPAPSASAEQPTATPSPDDPCAYNPDSG